MSTLGSIFEKLGVFYLGKVYDLESAKRTHELVLYDSKDLVTHAVCVGMTGSGKTGLCLGILEEAAIDGIPAIIIDPKGDLANLLLTFPELRAADFRPWINEDDARRKELSPDEYAAKQADLWTKGLAEWGEDGQRILRLRDAAEFAVYTPGSSAGLPVSILKSFDAPAQTAADDPEAFRDRVSVTVTSLLGLMGLDANPVQSRDHILLSAVLSGAWAARENLDLATLVRRVQDPPFATIGVMPLETVYPAKERFGLAMALNNLIAAPGFQAWMEGEPLDIGAMVHTKEGKPRHAIFSIAHLGDAERMFFVSLLLNQVLAWTRAQSGTTSLRAIVYMDEIAGYFPPTANPPSKHPLLTLMKQGRAFGVGVVLATQNPVDLDYKGLSNAGTWFIGRLQTDRDKQRVLDGLEGVAAGAGGFDRAAIDRTLSRLGPRVFLMHNVHDDAPAIIESRWCLSYLRGPLTRQQIKILMDPMRSGARAPSVAHAPEPEAPAPPAPAAAKTQGNGGTRPVLENGVTECFLQVRAIPPGMTAQYLPMVLGLARVYYADAKHGIEVTEPQSLLAPIVPGPVAMDWDRAAESDLDETDVQTAPHPGIAFAELPPAGASARQFTQWRKGFADALYRTGKLELFRCAPLKTISVHSENEQAFRLRLVQIVREHRDAQKDALRQKYAPRLDALRERARKAQARVQEQKSQAASARIGAVVSFGAAVLGAFTGRKKISATKVSKAATAARGAGRAGKEASDVGRAKEDLAAVQTQLADLEAQFTQECAQIDTSLNPATMPLDRIVLKPKKTNIDVRTVTLAWAPHTIDDRGAATPAW